MTNAAITTADTLDLSADRKTDAQITAAAASLGSVDLSATVAVLDAKKDAGVTVSGSTLTAGKDLSVLAEQSGTTGITAYQGNISALAGISAAYARAVPAAARPSPWIRARSRQSRIPRAISL